MKLQAANGRWFVQGMHGNGETILEFLASDLVLRNALQEVFDGIVARQLSMNCRTSRFQPGGFRG